MVDDLDDKALSLVKRMVKTIKRVGVEKVIAVLSVLPPSKNEGFTEPQKKLIDFVIEQIANAFQIGSEELMVKNIRGVAYEARSMCFILLKKHLDLTHGDISGIFGEKNHSRVSHAFTSFKVRNYDIKADRIFLEIYKETDKKVKEQKHLLWLQHN